MNNSLKNLTDVLTAFKMSNICLRPEGKDTRLLLEHIEAFLHLADRKEAFMSDLQKELGLLQPKTNRIFKYLRSLGWVDIKTAEHDERHRLVSITKDGLAFMDHLNYKLSRKGAE